MSRARRTVWGVADQGLSSLTNFGLAIVLARSLDLPAFGAASLAFAVYLVALNTSRSIVSEPFTVRHGTTDVAAWRVAASRSIGAALVIGLVIGLGIVVVGAGLTVLAGQDSLIGPVLVVTGMLLAGLLVQDAWRFAFLAAGRPKDAFVNDLVWAIVLVPTLGLAFAGGATDPWPFVLAWGAAGTVAGSVGIVQARVRPRPLRTRSWLREHRDLSSRYVVESLLLSTASPARLVVVTGIGGLAMAGSIRLGQVVLNAVHPLTQGLGLTVIPEAVATARRSIAALHRLIVLVSLALSIIPLAWGLAAWLAPTEFGIAIFGDSWSVARTTIPGMTLVFVASGLQSGALVGLRATAAAAYSLRARVVTAVLGLGSAIVGASTGDPGLAALAIGTGIALGVPVWWWQYLAAIRAIVIDAGAPAIVANADGPPTA